MAVGCLVATVITYVSVDPGAYTVGQRAPTVDHRGEDVEALCHEPVDILEVGCLGVAVPV